MTITVGTRGGLTTCESTEALLAAVADAECVILHLTDEADLTGEVRVALGLPALRLLGQHVSPPTYDVAFDGHVMEVVVPVADATGCTPVYAVATSQIVAVIHGDSSIEFAELHRRMAWDVDSPGGVGLFLLVEMALRSFRAAIREIRSRLDDLEDAMLAGTDRNQLVELSRIHRRISEMRRSMSEYGDAVIDLDDVLVTGPSQPMPNLLLVRAHVVAVRGVLNALDTLRDEAANVMDLGRSLATARQSLVINRLTVISTLLLPLTFVTGFFGMNFGWLTERIDSAASFWVLGIAVPVLIATVLIVFMWRAGWLLVLRPDEPPRDRGSDRQ